MRMKIWFHEMNKALQYNDSYLIEDSDRPPCPKCNGTMIYYGESRGKAEGEDYYECQSCGFHIMFDDIPYEDI